LLSCFEIPNSLTEPKMATAQQERAPEKKKQAPGVLRSIIAGSTAGAVEIGMFIERE
jgi:hypothetical protein